MKGHVSGMRLLLPLPFSSPCKVLFQSGTRTGSANLTQQGLGMVFPHLLVSWSLALTVAADIYLVFVPIKCMSGRTDSQTGKPSGSIVNTMALINMWLRLLIFVSLLSGSALAAADAGYAYSAQDVKSGKALDSLSQKAYSNVMNRMGQAKGATCSAKNIRVRKEWCVP